jgi:hypothetical protein
MEQIEEVLSVLPEVVERIRSLSPAWRARGNVAGGSPDGS